MIGDRIRAMRKQRGYSQEQLARKLQITQGAVSQWENGVTQPSAEQLFALADVFGVSANEMMGRTDVPEDDDAWAIRERMRRDPEYRLLFSAAEKATPDHIRAAAAMLKSLETPVWPDEETEPQEFPE